MNHHTQLQQAEQWLRLLFEGVPGRIELRPLAKSGGVWSPSDREPREVAGVRLGRSFNATAEVNFTSLAAAVQAMGQLAHVHAGLATRGPAPNGKAGNLVAIRVVWLDFDAKDFMERGEADSAEAALALIRERIAAFEIPPSAVVHSGGGLHVYWRLAEPFPLDAEANRVRLERAVNGLARHLGADERGNSAGRTLRVPGTINHKPERNGAVVTLEECHSDRAYDFERFGEFEAAGAAHEELDVDRDALRAALPDFSPEPPAAVRDLLARDPRLAAIFRRDLESDAVRRLTDRSPSGIDFNLALHLVRRDLDPDDVRRAVMASRHAAGLSPDGRREGKYADYVNRTVLKAAAWWERIRAERVQQIGGGDPDAVPEGAPTIAVNRNQLPERKRRAIEALQNRNEKIRPELFIREDHLAWLKVPDEGEPRVEVVTTPAMQWLLAHSAAWIRMNGLNVADTDPPAAVATQVLQEPRLPFPRLLGITRTPCLTPAGTVHATPGYDPASRLVFWPEPLFELGPVPQEPTREEVEQARELLLDVFYDVPLQDAASRANLLATMLTPVVRPLLVEANGSPSNVPGILIDAPTRGTGKTLTAEVLVVASTGDGPATYTWPMNDEDEARKMMTTVLSYAPPVVLFDNVRGELRSALLEKILTSTRHDDRLLGLNKHASLPVTTMLLFTANNLQLGGDLDRRMVRIRLVSDMERPWERDPREFRHPNLLAYVAGQRGELAAALLTLARAWWQAGRPAPGPKVPNLGKFERWRDTVGGILEVAGVPDFLGNQQDVYALRDDGEDRDAWEGFLRVAAETLPDRFTVRDVVESADAARAFPYDDEDGHSNRQQLGYQLGQRVDVTFGGFRLTRAGKVSGSNAYRVDRVGAAKPWRSGPTVVSGDESPL